MTDETKKADEIRKDAVTKPAPPSAEKPKAKADKVRRVVRVVAKQPSRWRIGRKFGPEPVEIDADELTEEDIRRLEDDPLLVVTDHPLPGA